MKQSRVLKASCTKPAYSRQNELKKRPVSGRFFCCHCIRARVEKQLDYNYDIDIVLQTLQRIWGAYEVHGNRYIFCGAAWLICH